MGVLAEAAVPASHRWIPIGMEVRYLATAKTSVTADAQCVRPARVRRGEGGRHRGGGDPRRRRERGRPRLDPPADLPCASAREPSAPIAALVLTSAPAHLRSSGHDRPARPRPRARPRSRARSAGGHRGAGRRAAVHGPPGRLRTGAPRPDAEGRPAAQPHPRHRRGRVRRGARTRRRRGASAWSTGRRTGAAASIVVAEHSGALAVVAHDPDDALIGVPNLASARLAAAALAGAPAPSDPVEVADASLDAAPRARPVGIVDAPALPPPDQSGPRGVVGVRHHRARPHPRRRLDPAPDDDDRRGRGASRRAARSFPARASSSWTGPGRTGWCTTGCGRAWT